MPSHLPIAAGTLTIASFALTGVVLGNAYYQKKQFYPSVVYITKSNPSMAAVYLLAFTLVLMLGKLLKKVFFGQLRAAELEQLVERSFYAVTETCLAFTVFRDDFSPKFVALFTVLLFLKAFHYLTDSRVDFMERSPVITSIFHLRVISLLLTLLTLDLLLVKFSYQSTVTHGASVQLVFGFEYAILLTVALNIVVKYWCHTIDLRLENPWDNKAVYLLYTELLVGFIKVILYAIFLLIMIRIHTFPLFIIRPMYLTLRSFKNALNGVIQSRRAIHNMNTLYPDASAEELAAVDNVCIICREEMAAGAKKLPCGHIFHTSCLRSWFQRQQTCPTCRMDILRQGAQAATNNVGAVPAPPPPAPQRAPPTTDPPRPQQNVQNGNPFAAFGVGGPPPPPFPFAPFPFPNQLHQQIQQQQAAAAAASSATTVSQQRDREQQPTVGAEGNSNTSAKPSTDLPFRGFPLPPFPFMPLGLMMPTPPANFEGLTLEELRNIEGNERSHVEARIRTLRNINTLLDAAAFQLNQYNSVVSSLPPEPSTVSESPTAAGATGLSHQEKVVNESTAGTTGEAVASGVDISDTPYDPEDPNELRRRRLQKFSSTEPCPSN